VLFIRVERIVSNEMFRTTIGTYACPLSLSSAFFYPPGRIVDILPGG
jgi:hypothetical protein